MLRSRKNNNGFSLVEIVVAMIILSIVAISSMMIFQNMQKVNEKSKEYADGEIFGNSLVDGLESLYYRDFLHETGEPKADKKYDSMIVDSKLETDIGYEKIDNYNMLNDGSIIFAFGKPSVRISFILVAIAFLSASDCVGKSPLELH